MESFRSQNKVAFFKMLNCVGGHVFMVDMFSPPKFDVNKVYV